MDHIASCQSRMARNHDASDHSVAQLTWLALALPGGHQVRGQRGSIIVEGGDSMTYFVARTFLKIGDLTPSCLVAGGFQRLRPVTFAPESSYSFPFDKCPAATLI